MTIENARPRKTRPKKPTSNAQSRRGAETKKKVEEAAGRLFAAGGYESTTMQAVADEAGVHVQTVYLAYGTKAAVLAAAATRLVAGDEDPDSHPSTRRWVRQIMATDDPHQKLRLYVRHIRELAPRVARLIDTLRAAAPADDDVAAFLARMEEGRREGPYAVLEPVLEAGVLRPSLTLAAAADITFALASFDTFHALVDMRGWTWSRAETWIVEQLAYALLADPITGD